MVRKLRLMRGTRGVTRALVAVCALAVLAGCNPLVFNDAQQVERVAAVGVEYRGPREASLQVSVTGAATYDVRTSAKVWAEDLVGPMERPCAGTDGTIAPCSANAYLVQTYASPVVPGDGSAYVPLIRLWPGEKVSIDVMCDDGLGSDESHWCPRTVDVKVRTVDDTGALIGDLVRSEYVDR